KARTPAPCARSGSRNSMLFGRSEVDICCIELAPEWLVVSSWLFVAEIIRRQVTNHQPLRRQPPTTCLMKRVIAIISFYVLALLCAMLPLQQTDAPGARSSSKEAPTSATPGPTPKPEARETRETRALWVVRTTMAAPESVRSLVQRAKETGFTDLIVQVRGRGDAYYDSSIEPRAEALTQQPVGFDPLALTIEEAHRHGIKVHAW